MRFVTNVTKNTRIFTVLLGAAFSLTTASVYAAETTEDALDTITVTEQLSAYAAKRLARQYLVDSNFATGIGPGKAKIKSITRDNNTWIVQVALSDGGWVMNRRAFLYIDANSALVSEVAPDVNPTPVAAQ